MGAINVNVDARKLDEVTRMLADIKGGVPKALVGAINDTTKATVTQISKSIRERVNIKKKDIDKHINRQPLATTSRMHGRIRLSETKRLGLIYFGATAFGSKGKGAKKQIGGVRYRISKQGGTKTVPGAFIAKVGVSADGEEKRQVFKRLGKKRKPIVKLQGISPWGAFVMSGGRKRTQAEATALLEKNLDRRVNFLLLKHSGAIK